MQTINGNPNKVYIFNGARKEKSETPFFRPIYVGQIPHKSLGSHVNVFSNKPNVAQHHNCKQNAGVAYYGLYDQNKIQNNNLYSISFQKIYTLLGLSLMVCAQFHLEQKRQFSFRDTLKKVR